MPWPHSDIKSCCHQSAHVFTFRYDSTLLGRAFFTPKVFLHEIIVYCAEINMIITHRYLNYIDFYRIIYERGEGIP